MRRPRISEVGSFAGAVAVVGAAAVLTRACPGGCGPCTSCATAVVPVGSAVSMVGVAAVASAAGRRAEKRPRDGERTRG